MAKTRNYKVLDIYNLDIAPTAEELNALEADLLERHGSLMETGSITICISSDQIIFAYDPEWIFARHYKGQLPFRSAEDKVSDKAFYESLGQLTDGFFLPVVIRRHGSHILDVSIMLRCLTMLSKTA